MRTRTIILALALLGVLTALMASCSSTARGTGWHFGDALVIRVTDLRQMEDVRFTDSDGKHYVIRPIEEDKQLAAVKLEVRTLETNVVYLSISRDSVTLRDGDSVEYPAIDFRERREEVPETHSRENAFSPFIWGDVELPSKCGEPVQACELVGWMLFEVPRDMEPDLVLWDATDTVYVRF